MNVSEYYCYYKEYRKKHQTKFGSVEPKIIYLVSLKISTDNPNKIKNLVKQFVKQYSDVKNGANPGLVFCQTEKIPEAFTKLSSDAMWKLINRNEAKKILSNEYSFTV